MTNHGSLRERLENLGLDGSAVDDVSCAILQWLSAHKLRIVPEQATDAMAPSNTEALGEKQG